MKSLTLYVGTWLLLPYEFQKWLVHSSIRTVRRDLPTLDERSSCELPCGYLYLDGVVKQGDLMSPNPRGKLEDLVVGCVCVV